MSTTAGSQARTRALPRETPSPLIHHIGLKTQRRAEMLAWYAAATNMEIVMDYPQTVFCSNDGANHRIVFMSSGTEAPDPFHHTGLQHFAFEFPSLEGLLATYARLKAVGSLPEIAVDHGPTTSFYYADPDGNEVELQYDNFGDWGRSKEWMTTSPEFAANLVGTWVDPDAMIVAWEGGASAEELHRRAYAGEFPPIRRPNLRLPPEVEVEHLLRLGYRDGNIPPGHLPAR
jgi:catechol 2,3-dioxygenase